jgi:hypothetical protein
VSNNHFILPFFSTVSPNPFVSAAPATAPVEGKMVAGAAPERPSGMSALDDARWGRGGALAAFGGGGEAKEREEPEIVASRGEMGRVVRDSGWRKRKGRDMMIVWQVCECGGLGGADCS